MPCVGKVISVMNQEKLELSSPYLQNFIDVVDPKKRDFIVIASSLGLKF
jgi:hypothetical protein